MGLLMITGSSGFVGKHLVTTLLKQGYPPNKLLLQFHNNLPSVENSAETLLTKTDLTNKQQVFELFWKYDIDKIVHLAAIASPKSTEIDKFYDLNLKATHYLLDCCKSGTDIIYASSVVIYGMDGCFYENDKTTPKNLYAITKLASEHVINIYYEKGKIRPKILRLGLTVGRGMTHGRLFQAKTQNQINLIGKPPGDYGPVCHIDDIVSGIISAINYQKPKLTVNLCNSDYISLEDSLKLVNPNIQLNWSGIDKPQSLIGYINKAYYELNWQPTMTSRQAVERMVQDDKNNPIS